jgi:cytochrome P450
VSGGRDIDGAGDGALLDIVDHDTYVHGVPHETFRRLRDTDPVSWWPEHDTGAGFWAVTRYEDVLRVSRDHETFTSEQGIRLEEMADDEAAARRTMMELDPPEHTRLRRVVNRGFTRKTVATYEQAFRELTRLRLDRVLGGSDEFDFVEEIARELPIRLLCSLLGVPDSDADKLVEWGDGMIANTDPEYTQHVVDQVDTDEFRLLPFRSPAALEVFRYAAEAATARRTNPRDDIITKLLQPTPDGEPLTDLEFKNFFALLVVAGNETTRHTITQGLMALLGNADQMAHWRDDPSMSPRATEEVLRWTSVTMHFRRTATRDVELAGTKIRAGDKVVVWYVSANRDERQFPDPFSFDLRRDPNEHVAFGLHGPHLCLGAWLARLEIRVTFEELLPRLANIEVRGPAERLRSNFISGVKHLPVRVTLA